MRFLFLAFAFATLVSSVLADPRDFAVDAKPIFQSSFNWAGAPVAIEIENKGADARGYIIASEGGSTTRYPIELPTGAKKRIVTYRGGSEYGGPSDLVFDSNQGRFAIPYIAKGSYAYGTTAIVALISDTSGDLGFLRQAEQSNPRQQNILGDAYCVPENAPERPVGYMGISAVVLGPGSDRLSDAAVKALQSYALTGGAIIFIGGASASTLSDPRWADLLPATGFQTRTVIGSPFLNSLAGRTNREAVTVTAGTPIPSALVQKSGGVAMVSERGLGLGKVMVFAFNPFEEPMARWPGRKRLFQASIRSIEYQRAQQYLANLEGVGGYEPDPYGYGGRSTAGSYSGATPTRMYGSTVHEDRRDPFSVQLPAPTKVFWILAAFFIVVVPVNFCVLRLMRKGEWAWLTSPAICLVFSGIFLNQASDLYSARLSTATTGALIAQEGVKEAMFVGSTQMFFPSGGSYDLKMDNVDQLATEMPYYDYSMGGRQDRTQVDPVDVGTIRVPDLRAANLAFEEIGYRQRFSKLPPITMKATKMASNHIRLTIRNGTTSPLANSVVVFDGRRYNVAPISPGQEHSMVLSNDGPREDQGSFLESQTIRQKVAILETSLPDLRPGPQIGAAASGRSNIRFLYVAPTPLGGRS